MLAMLKFMISANYNGKRENMIQHKKLSDKKQIEAKQIESLEINETLTQTRLKHEKENYCG